jgi:hypothetical protein
MPHKLAEVLERKIHSGDVEVNMLDLSYRTAVEGLGRAGLGYPFDSLDESKRNAYTDSVKNFLYALYLCVATDAYFSRIVPV